MKPITDDRPLPTKATPRAGDGIRPPLSTSPAMQEAYRRSERQPRLISMNSKPEKEGQP